MFLNILSTLATAALFPTLMHAQSVAPDFQSGRCKFDASVYQFCDGNTLVPLLFVSPLYDDAGKDFMAGTAYIDLSRGQTLEAVVAEQDMRISFETDGVQFTYQNKEVTCTTENWTDEEPDCAKKDERKRSQQMHCEFDCVVANQRIKRAENDAIALPPILSNPSPPTLPATGSTTGSSLPYAPGHCSFHLQLFSQCLHTPTAGWHTQTLGMIHSIQDNNRETVATYPEGAGRIDDRAVALTGIGELRIGYDTKVEEVFFAFDKVGGWWSTGTKDAEGIMGLCEWGAWTRPQGKCDESVSEHPRLSGMTCLFRC